MPGPAHLRVFRFDAGATFEGGLLAAVERMQVSRETTLLDALFLHRDAESGALEAVDLGSGTPDATFASLLDFRLDPGRRRTLTERTLSDHPGGVPRGVIDALAAELRAGEAIFAVLHTGPAATALEDAAARSGGRSVAHEEVEALTLGQVGPRLRAAVA